MKFDELNIKPEILANIKLLGYTEPTKIQEEVIKEASSGKNIIGQSQTGTGKTAAFLISILQNIDINKSSTQAVIIAPTRELVMQIREEIVALSANTKVKSVPIYWGAPIFKQKEILAKHPQIVVGTPGRLIDVIKRNYLDWRDVKYFVLDEADRMLDMWFVDDIDFLWGFFKNIKQSFAFSATVTNELKSIIQKYLGLDYVYIKANVEITVDKIDHAFIEASFIEKYPTLKKYIKLHKDEKVLVFVRTKHDTEEIASKLDADWISVWCLNWDMRQRERTRALADFKAWNVNVFVVTDIAARWINVKDISLVVNFDVPDDPESYIHRIGRTGRAGAKWKAIMFVSQKEKLSLNNIERRNRITIKQVDDKGEEVTRYEWSTLYQWLWRRNKTWYWRAKRSFWNSSKTSFWNKPKFWNSKPFEGSSRLSFWNKSNFSSNSESSDFWYWKSRPSYWKTFKKQNSGSNDDKKWFLDSDKSKNSRPSFWNKSKFWEPKKFQKSDWTLKNRPKGNFKSFKKTKNFSDNKNFGSKKGVFKK